MMAPGAKGIEDGVELRPPGNRVTARVAAIVRSSASSSWIPDTSRILLEDPNEAGFDSGGRGRLSNHNCSHRTRWATAEPRRERGGANRWQVRAWTREPHLPGRQVGGDSLRPAAETWTRSLG